MQEYCREIYVIPLDRRVNLFNAAWGLWQGLPLNIGYFYSRATKRKIDGIIEKTRPDLIYVQLLRMAPYVRSRSAQEMSIDYMDAFSLRVLRRAKQSNIFVKFLWAIEAKLLERQEKTYAKQFKNRFIIANTDRLFLEQRKLVEDLTVLRNGVDTVFFQPKPIVEKEFDLVFVGNMSYHPNILAAEYLVEEIAPLLRKAYPGLKVLIAGADPVPGVKKLASDEVVVSGYMKDIREAYGAGKIFVAPIFAGSGMQNKILEAMAMELPCVTTPQVIDAIGGIEKLVCSAANSGEFVSHLLELLRNKKMRIELGKLSREYIVKNLSWEASCSPLDKLNCP